MQVINQSEIEDIEKNEKINRGSSGLSEEWNLLQMRKLENSNMISSRDKENPDEAGEGSINAYGDKMHPPSIDSSRKTNAHGT